jgi:hypothetical protein
MADLFSASAAVAVSILAMYAGGRFNSKQSRQSGGTLIHRTSMDTPVSRDFMVAKFSAASVDTYSNPLEYDRATPDVLIGALRVAIFLNDQPRITSISQVIARCVVSNGVLDVWSRMVSVNEGASFDEIGNALTVFNAAPLDTSAYIAVVHLLHLAWTEGVLASSPDPDMGFAADVRCLFDGQWGLEAPALRTIRGTGAFGSEMPLGVSVMADKVPTLLVNKSTCAFDIRRLLGLDWLGRPWSGAIEYLSNLKSIEIVMDVRDVHLCQNIRFPGSLTRLKLSFMNSLTQDIAKAIIAAAPDTLQMIDMVDATENSVVGHHSCERFHETDMERYELLTIRASSTFSRVFKEWSIYRYT